MFDIIDLNELQDIATYYKKKFKLETFIDITSNKISRVGSYSSLFNTTLNYVFCCSETIRRNYYSLDKEETHERYSIDSLKEYSICVLFHELGHAISFNRNKKWFLGQVNGMNLCLYN